VEALIALTKLIKDKQPKLFDHLLKMRDKNNVKALINLDDKKPFVYTSGRYDAEFNKTTIAFPLAPSKNGNILVYDLRYDPSDFIHLDSKELAKKIYATWEERKAEDFVKLPVKELQYNHAPAVAPVGVLEQGDGWAKINLTKELVEKHRNILLSAPTFAENLRTLYENKPEFKKSPDAEAQLYDGFLNDRDRLRVETVRNAPERQLADFHPEFTDERLTSLFLRYKARSFPKTLSGDEIASWEQWRTARIQKQLPGFMKSFQRLSKSQLSDEKQFILQELQLWLESIAPADTSNQDSMD